MEKTESFNKEYMTIDLLHIAKALLQRWWLIALSGFLAAVIGFSIAAFAITPKYSASIMLYVNNNSFSVGSTSFSISSSEIVAAQSLVKTYSVLLKNRTTLERVAEKAEVSYTTAELSGMITASSADETEVMKVTVTCEDPYEAALIANSIAEVLPVRVSEIVEGSSMAVVDSAVPRLGKVSPSITRHTAIGFIIGAMLSVLVLVIMAIMDDTIHDEEYLLQNYEYPILAKVPDLLSSGTKKYAYYSQKKRTDVKAGD